MRFDYLHSARPVFVQRLLEVRVPERFHSVLFALCGALAVIAGAWSIESYRLQEALKMQAFYQRQHDVAEVELKRANVYYGRVRSLVDLDRRVRHIATSGDTDVRTLAEIANELPQHAWLTGISHDGDGLSLEGRAKDLSVVSNVMRGLMRAKDLRAPTLQSASLDKDASGEAAMKYAIHIDGAGR